MKCERCGKNLGEFLCSVCKRVVCSDCKTMRDGKIFCLDHSGVKVEKPVEKPKKEFKALKNAIKTIAILLGGMILIFYITNYYIVQMKLPFDVPFVTNIINLFVDFGIRLIEFVALILIILIIGFFVARKFLK